MLRRIALTCLAHFVPLMAAASGSVTDVTPDNRASQPLSFQVQHERYEGGTVRFEIRVSTGSDEVSPRHQGRYIVFQDSVTVRPGTLRMGSKRLSKVVAVCSVEEQAVGDTLLYEVQADSSILAKVTFAFLNFEPHGMPAFAAYGLMLGKFAVEP